MKRMSTLLCMAGIGCLLSTVAAFADPPSIVSSTFEKDAGDWKTMSANGGSNEAAKISITHDAANVKTGMGSLRLDYAIKKGEANLLLLPLQPPSLAKMQSLHFWIKTDHATSMMIVLSEKDGGRYQSTFNCSANAWQEVSLSLSDFTLSDDDGSPKDPDGKLDPDQVEGVGMIDTGCYLAQMLGDSPQFVDFGSGAHALYLNAFTINDTALPSAPAAAPREINLTPLVRPQTDWLVLGTVSIQKVNEKPLSAPAMKAVYMQTKGKISGMLRRVPVGSLAGVTQLSFTIASKNAANIMFEIEDTNGNKFQSTVMMSGGETPQDVSLNTADLAAAQDSKDPSAKIDMPLVKQILIADITGFGDVAEKENSLWINKLKAAKK